MSIDIFQRIVIRGIVKTAMVFTLLLLLVSNAYALNLIINAENDTDTISQRKVRAIYGLHLKRWASGAPIKVFTYSDQSDLHRRFCKDLLLVFPHQLRAAWDRATYSGTGQAPIVVSSYEEMISKVIENPGAIGYVDSDELLDERIKTLQVK